jgi:hypothetical protein
MKINKGINIFKFSKLTQFANKVVLTYTITINFYIQFSQLDYYYFH